MNESFIYIHIFHWSHDLELIDWLLVQPKLFHNGFICKHILRKMQVRTILSSVTRKRSDAVWPQTKLRGGRETDCTASSRHSFIPPRLPSDACACHLAPFSLLRVYINTNPPKKGKIFPFFLLWIKFQQTWLRIRHASQIKVCLGEREGGRIRAQTQLPSLSQNASQDYKKPSLLDWSAFQRLLFI